MQAQTFAQLSNHFSKFGFFIVLLSVFNLAYSCQPSQNDDDSPTIEEQAALAGIVLEGIVTKVEGNESSSVITLTKVKYYKSCGPQSILVSGFSSSASCGVDPFELETKIIVFGCESSDMNSDVKLNKIYVQTGAILWTQEIQEEIQNILGQTEEPKEGGKCGNQEYEECSKDLDQYRLDQEKLSEEDSGLILGMTFIFVLLGLL